MTNREIDVLVAEKIMGWTEIEQRWTPLGLVSYGNTPEPDNKNHLVPNYSTNMGAAWLVVGKLAERYNGDFSVNVYQRESFKPNWRCTMTVFSRPIAGYTRDSAPMVICLTALKAVGVVGE